MAQAENHYRKALEITPNTPIASNNLAWLIAAGGVVGFKPSTNLRLGEKSKFLCKTDKI